MKGLHPDMTPLEKGILTKLRAIRRENTLRVFREGEENLEYWQTDIDEAMRKKGKGSSKLDMALGGG